jgi:hypothetical protein
MALAADAACLRAFSLKAKAQIKMGKSKKAKATLVAGMKLAASENDSQELKLVAQAAGISLDSAVGSVKGNSSSDTHTQPVKKRDLNSLSVWNSKSTWEEVDLTDWAITRLEVLLQGIVITLPDGLGTIRTTKLHEVQQKKTKPRNLTRF